MESLKSSINAAVEAITPNAHILVVLPSTLSSDETDLISTVVGECTHAGMDVSLATKEGTPVTLSSSSSTTTTTTTQTRPTISLFEVQHTAYDGIVLLLTESRAVREASADVNVLESLGKFHDAGKPVAALDPSSSILAAAKVSGSNVGGGGGGGGGTVVLGPASEEGVQVLVRKVLDALGRS